MTPEAILALACLVGQPARALLPHEAHEMAKVIQAESGGNPLAINVNGPGGGPVRVRSLTEAVAAVEQLVRAGRSVDVGLSQVNLRAHPNAFAGLAEAFDPRANVCAGARIYVAGVTRAARCTYNTGRPVCANGYPDRVEAAAAVRARPVAAAPSPPPMPDPEEPWDVWAAPSTPPAPVPPPPSDEKEAASPDGAPAKSRLVVELVQ
jgi:hypothetical protein